MKSYISKVFIFIGLFLLFVYSYAFASTDSKLLFYRDLWENWLLEEVHVAAPTVVLTTPAGNPLTFSNDAETDPTSTEDVSETTVSTRPLEDNSDTKYILALTSASTELPAIAPAQTLFLVCDTEYTSEAADFSCDKNSIRSGNENNLRIISPETVVFHAPYMGGYLIVIPETFVLLNTPNEPVAAYLKSIQRSTQSAEVRSPTEEVLGSIVFELLAYLLLTFVFVVLLKNSFTSVLANPKVLLTRGFYTGYFSKFEEAVQIYQGLFIITFIGLLLFYIPLVLVISIKDISQISVDYIFDYVQKTVVLEFFRTEDAILSLRVLFFLYHIILLINLALILLPSAINLLKDLQLRAFEKQLKHSHIKWVAIFALIVLLFLTLVLKPDELILPLLAVLFFVLFILISFSKHSSKTFDSLFSLKEKILVVSAVVIVIFLGFLIDFYISNKPTSYKHESLIGISDSIVLLPYTKHYGNDIIFEPYEVNGTFPVFVNDYGVFHPDYEAVHNKNLSEFKNEGDFIIVSYRNSERIYKNIIDAPDLLALLESNTPTSRFFISNLPSEFNSKYTLQLSFSCENIADTSFNITGDFYYISNSTDIEKESHKLFHFPGCINSNEEFMQEINLESFLEEMVVAKDGIFSINLPPYVQVIGLELYEDTDLASVRYIGLNPETRVVYSSLNQGSSMLTVYSSGATGLVEFIREKNALDISQPINTLIKKGALGSPFIIWSTEHYAVIKNDFK